MDPIEEDYLQTLRSANLIESVNPSRCYEILVKCSLQLSPLIISLPKYQFHQSILQHRIQYLENASHTIDTSSSTPLEPVVSSEFESNHKASSDIISDEAEIISEIKPEVESNEVILEKAVEIPVDKEVIQQIYDLLIAESPMEYNQYFNFYSGLSTVITKSIDPLLYDTGSIGFWVGDTHGSYKETIVLLKYFEIVLQLHLKIKIIFLGDYVDRNPQDLENLTIIVAFWLLHRDNVVLLRGNHEDSLVNQQYGFIQNLKLAFSLPELVDPLYAHILHFFTCLPVGHVMNLQKEGGIPAIRILAVHGGIPVNVEIPQSPVILEEMVRTIHTDCENYLEFEDYMNWLLWADPRQISGIRVNIEEGRNEFGQDVFDQFMQANNLHFLIRGHEVVKNGYKYFFNNRLVSLFSTSFYKNAHIGVATFLRLEAGKPPVFLSIDSTLLQQDITRIG